jgi:hypothetical protein
LVGDGYSAPARIWVSFNTAAASLATSILEEFGVLRAPEAHRVGEGEVAEILGGDQPVFDELMRFRRTSKWPTSEMRIALMRAPTGLTLLNATAFIRSSASQPK